MINEQPLPVATDAMNLADAPATNGIQGAASFEPPRSVCILRGIISLFVLLLLDDRSYRLRRDVISSYALR